ncbi:radical SAM/SPASM domain-containing protein [Streptomyces sp. W1SF4]|uniref:radical SAM/SPASM domain-containing protein n=1 Tax=Streptomyces sp. W1SF4 TaxID=2305220 RepID=UPI000F6C0EF9|nr:radical SAM/SPASM domain-containing protein [Streptomyces sp. W1SF4]AZM91420.1 radical SAM protein [Streptomyces sp. W1SF4]
MSTTTPPATTLKFAWLELTRNCNEICTHCYADSGPGLGHGTMTVADWVRVIDELADMGGLDVQFIGGEPMLYPELPELIGHAAGRGLGIEIFSNMTHVRPAVWEAITEHGAKLATSYYSDDAAEHDAITKLRGSHRKTRANIERAVELGIPIRGGVVSLREGQRAQGAVTDLQSIGVQQVGGDRMRAFGRASQGARPQIKDLCGHCAHEKCAIGPDGAVWPCVLGRFIDVGNVKEEALVDIWSGDRITQARAEIAAVHGAGAAACTPPQFLPMCGPCGPCVPSVKHCDPQEAPLQAATIATT